MEKTSSKFYVKFNKVLRLKAEFRRNKEKVKCLRKKLDCPVKPGNDKFDYALLFYRLFKTAEIRGAQGLRSEMYF